jgi:hypothetical protein
VEEEGKMKDVPKKIQRFPREPEDYPPTPAKKPTRNQILRAQRDRGEVPLRYRTLTKLQMKVARAIAKGEPASSICIRYPVSRVTYYRWLNYHPLFQQYYLARAKAYAQNVDSRLDAKLPRAIRVIEDTLESKDPYHAASMAVTLLKGRGKFANTSQSKHEIDSKVHLDGKIENLGGKDSETALAFMEMMLKMAQGPPPVQPKMMEPRRLTDGEIKILEGATPVTKEEVSAT